MAEMKSVFKWVDEKSETTKQKNNIQNDILLHSVQWWNFQFNLI